MAEQPDDGEKTEEPTPKKLRDALKKGDVTKSQELITWFGMLGICLCVGLMSSSTVENLTPSLTSFFENADKIRVTGAMMQSIWTDAGYVLGKVFLLPMGLLFLFAIAGNMIQHPLVWTAEKVKPKASKISPIAGVKRLFSQESLVNFLKGIVKISVVGGLMLAVLWPLRDTIDTMIFRPISGILPEARTLILRLLAAILGVMTVVAALDYLFQRQRWHHKQKMSHREIKDEFKQAEGDPHIKARIRQLRNERAGKRMMAAVPEAAVVIVNPQHYSVALKYDETMPAPICVAKGIDSLALRIKSLARELDIPIIENPALARALHAHVEIDEEIPEQHYKAVAQIIGFVMRQRRPW